MTTRLYNVMLHNGRSTALVLICSTAKDALAFAADRCTKTNANVAVTDGGGHTLSDEDLLNLIDAEVSWRPSS